jgi:hypothetical protein
MSIGIIESRRAGWTFWLGWMLASIGGAIVFLIVVFPLNLLFMQIVPEPNTADSLALSVVFTAISSGVMGALFGLAQWLVLRRVLPAMERWVLATPIGYGLVFGAIPIIRFDAIPQLGGAMIFLMFGIVLGILQWLVLRERVYRAGWWIAISTAGWAIAFIFIGAAYLSGLYIEPFDLIAAFLVPTGVTGAGMVWLLQRTARAEPLGNPETMTLSE